MNSVVELLSKKQAFHGAYYLFGAGENFTEENIQKWFQSFYQGYLEKNQIPQSFTDIRNAPDVLFLFPEKNKSFKSEQFSAVYSFQETKALTGNHKFCLISPCTEVTNVIWNKLLKVLEEPLNNTVFLLFSPKKVNLMQTIQSRVLPLRLMSADFSLMNLPKAGKQKAYFIDLLDNCIAEDKGFSSFLDQYNSYKNSENDIISDFCTWFSDQTQVPRPFKEKFNGLISWLEESKLYHNPLSERAYFIYQFAKTIQQYQKSL